MNITRITLSKDGVMNKLLNCGEITVELTGLRIKEVKLLSIDNVDQVAKYLQDLLYEFNAQRQMQYQEEKKVENIVDKY